MKALSHISVDDFGHMNEVKAVKPKILLYIFLNLEFSIKFASFRLYSL